MNKLEELANAVVDDVTVKKSEESPLAKFAKEELERIGMYPGEGGYNGSVATAIYDLIKLFSEQDHTGFTASYTIGAFYKLAMWRPLAPLTGKDDEWNDIGHGTYQNKRYSGVFKDATGAYDIHGKIFSRDGGKTWFEDTNSWVDITFPYIVPNEPEKVYLEKEESNETDSN